MLYQKFTDERMSEVTHLAAQVFANIDGQKAAEFLNKFMNAIFPEMPVVSGEVSAKQMLSELVEFSKKDIMLVQGKGGLTLEMAEKKG